MFSPLDVDGLSSSSFQKGGGEWSPSQPLLIKMPMTLKASNLLLEINSRRDRVYYIPVALAVAYHETFSLNQQ